MRSIPNGTTRLFPGNQNRSAYRCGRPKCCFRCSWLHAASAYTSPPRARGNGANAVAGVVRIGAIPASAGERTSWRRRPPQARGYPRERGGTWCKRTRGRNCWGLSPRARGNGRHGRRPGTETGAIPASAGERPGRNARSAFWRGYPRERGGTLMILIEVPSSEGLSPRARGNGAGVSSVDPGGGAIPASAGERLTSTASAGALRGYPRERGGTTYCSAILPSPSGLSPRARGNAELIAFCVERSGAIPSSAGERR